ncbi:MAG TPA: mandelate racemase/muconate lactonizing enzyme family protein [Candidatus Dormibacteraeota bacterium]|nr:mandelate racemase/muconate lactonizing enzyme family protein [Candidatus Dormibacteraeota bacterium]
MSGIDVRDTAITRVRSRVLDLPLPADFRPAWGRKQVQRSFLVTLVEIETACGLTGVTAAEAGLEAAVAIERFATPRLVGQDASRPERLIGVLRDAEILGAPIYCLEIALWDIAGKLAGLPTSKLWGAHTDRVPAYCATGEVRAAEARVDDCRRILDDGFRAVKLRFHSDDPRDDIAVVEAIRSELGDRLAILVDANQAGGPPGLDGHRQWDFRTALEVALELERLGVEWLEEPLPRHDYAGLRRLRDRLGTLQLAGGENNHGMHEFAQLIERGCYDVLQPDAVLSEGVYQLRKVAALAEAAGLLMAPHTWTHGIGLLANLHLVASIPNASWFEFPHEPPGWPASALSQMLVEKPWIDAEGCLAVGDRPGFGFELDEELIAKHTASTFG